MVEEEQNIIQSSIDQENKSTSIVSLKIKNKDMPRCLNELNMNLSVTEKEDTKQLKIDDISKETKSSEQIDETFEENKKEQEQNQVTDINNIDIQQSSSKSNAEIVDEIQTENNDAQNQSIDILMLKPLPKLVDQLLTFLSEDLISQTLKVFIYKYFISLH